MSAGFCLHCGLKLPEDDRLRAAEVDACGDVHSDCIQAWLADQAAAAKRPKTAQEQQLDRIEGLLLAIRDRYSL